MLKFLLAEAWLHKWVFLLFPTSNLFCSFSPASVTYHQRSSIESLACPCLPLITWPSGRRMNWRNRSDSSEEDCRRCLSHWRLASEKGPRVRAGAERLALGLGECLATGILDWPKEENNLGEIKKKWEQSLLMRIRGCKRQKSGNLRRCSSDWRWSDCVSVSSQQVAVC